MKVIGLTGGPGMGKSTSAQLLRTRSIPVVDTDDLARELVEPGQPALGEIQQTFGSDIVGRDGCLRREALAQRVFADAAAREQLEKLLHPRIRKRWQEQVDAWKAEKRPLAVVVIPLLFETNAQGDFDSTICVACSAAAQRQRLLARGWSAAQVEQRIAAQWPIEKKMAKAEFVIWTEGEFDSNAEQLDRILLRCKSSALC
jgi:dephospho-CoA kinase